MADLLQQTIDKLGAAFTEFRTANDERLKQIEAKGVADPVLVAKVDAANADITRLKTLVDEQQTQIRAAETLAARPQIGGSRSDRVEAEMRSTAQFLAVKRQRRVDPDEVTTADREQYQAYRKAFIGAHFRSDKESWTPEIRAALSVGVDTQGGYWVPPDISGPTVKMIYESSPMRQLATVTTTSSDRLQGFQDLGEAGSGWVGETESRGETSTPDIGQYEIVVKEQYAAPRATQQIIDDATLDVEAWLAEKIADRFARQENLAFVLGDGVKKPKGFATYTAGTPSATTWNVVRQINSGGAGVFAATAPGDYLISMVYALKAPYRANATWVMPRLVEAEARKLKDTDGAYLLQSDFSNKGAVSLLGFPVVNFEDMAALAADSLSVAFGDFRAAYTIVDRLGIRMLRDPYTAKPYVIFYSIKRVGGAVTNFEAIVIMKFAV